MYRWQAFAGEMCTAVLMTPVRWLPHSQLLLLVEACLCLKACYKVSGKHLRVRYRNAATWYLQNAVDTFYSVYAPKYAGCSSFPVDRLCCSYMFGDGLFICVYCSLQDLAYAQVAEYLRPKDSLDYLGHQMHVLESDTKALQLLLGEKNAVFIHVFIQKSQAINGRRN